MKRILFAAALLIGMLGTEAAGAQSRTIIIREQHGRTNTNSRDNHNNRVSALEARQIQQRRMQLQQERRMALRDGWISPAEQRRLARLQEQLDFYVFQQSRDRRIR